MIYIYNGSKFKVKKYKTSEQLIKALNIDYINGQIGFDKLNESGVDLYCSLIPKMSSDYGDEMIWDTDSKKLEETYWLIAEEI